MINKIEITMSWKRYILVLIERIMDDEFFYLGSIFFGLIAVPTLIQGFYLGDNYLIVSSTILLGIPLSATIREILLRKYRAYNIISHIDLTTSEKIQLAKKIYGEGDIRL